MAKPQRAETVELVALRVSITGPQGSGRGRVQSHQPIAGGAVALGEPVLFGQGTLVGGQLQHAVRGPARPASQPGVAVQLRCQADGGRRRAIGQQPAVGDRRRQGAGTGGRSTGFEQLAGLAAVGQGPGQAGTSNAGAHDLDAVLAGARPGFRHRGGQGQRPVFGQGAREGLALVRSLIDAPHFEAGVGQRTPHTPGGGKGGDRSGARGQSGQPAEQWRCPQLGVLVRREAVQPPGVDLAKALLLELGERIGGVAEVKVQGDPAIVEQAVVPAADRGRVAGGEIGVGRQRVLAARAQLAPLIEAQRMLLDGDVLQSPAGLPGPGLKQGRKVQAGAKTQLCDGKARRLLPARGQVSGRQEHALRLRRAVWRVIDVIEVQRARLVALPRQPRRCQGLAAQGRRAGGGAAHGCRERAVTRLWCRRCPGAVRRGGPGPGSSHSRSLRTGRVLAGRHGPLRECCALR